MDTGCPYRCRSGKRHHRRAQPGKAHTKARGGEGGATLAPGPKARSGVCPKRTKVVTLYTDPPPNSTTICLDELGPVSPRTYPPAPGWSPDGHRIKAPLEYGRGPEKVWVYGALRICDGEALTLTAPRAIPKATCACSKPSNGGIRAAICTS